MKISRIKIKSPQSSDFYLSFSFFFSFYLCSVAVLVSPEDGFIQTRSS